MEPLSNREYWEDESRSARFQRLQGSELVALFDIDLSSVDDDILNAVRQRLVLLATPILRRSTATPRLVKAEEAFKESLVWLLNVLRHPNEKQFSALIANFEIGLCDIADLATRQVEKDAGFRRLPDTKEGPKPKRPMGRREIPFDPAVMEQWLDQEECEAPNPESRIAILRELDEATKARFALAIRAVEKLELEPKDTLQVATDLSISEKTLKRHLNRLREHLENLRKPPTKQAAE